MGVFLKQGGIFMLLSTLRDHEVIELLNNEDKNEPFIAEDASKFKDYVSNLPEADCTFLTDFVESTAHQTKDKARIESIIKGAPKSSKPYQLWRVASFASDVGLNSVWSVFPQLSRVCASTTRSRAAAELLLRRPPVGSECLMPKGTPVLYSLTIPPNSPLLWIEHISGPESRNEKEVLILIEFVSKIQVVCG